MNPFTMQRFGLGATPTAEASGACASRGGVVAYREPDPNTPDQPFSWSVDCGDGSTCDGGAERTTNCAGPTFTFNVRPKPSMFQGIVTRQIPNPPRVFLQKAWDHLKRTLAYSTLAERAQPLEDARRSLVSAKTYLSAHGFPTERIWSIDRLLEGVEYLAGIAAAGVEPVPNYPPSLSNFMPHLTVTMKGVDDEKNKYFVTIDAPESATATPPTPGAQIEVAVGPGLFQRIDVAPQGAAGSSLPVGGGLPNAHLPGGGTVAPGDAGGPSPGTPATTPAPSRKWPYVVGGALLLVGGAVALSMLSKRR